MNRLSLCGLALFATMLSTNTFAQGERKVLLVGIDGVQFEKLQTLNTPNFDRLYVEQAYTGGIDGAESQQSTYSGPGWSTILTGVWANKHQVTSNSSGLANSAFPSLFKRIKEADSNHWVGSIVNWSPINTQFFTQDLSNADLIQSGLSDDQVTAQAVARINSGIADFLFLHLDEPDHAGHSYCFGSAYNNSITDSDARLGQLLDAVDARNALGENWLVLVTTDHGRDTLGCNHGAQTSNEKTIFIASNQMLNLEHSEKVTDISNTDFNGIYGHSAQTAIAPTVLRHLGITLDSNWMLDGTPMIGTTGVRKLLPGNSSTAEWYAQSPGQVSVYRNGVLVDSVDALSRAWQDLSDFHGTADYVLVQDQTPVAIRRSRLDITAALDWNVSRAYYFRDDSQYVRYNKTSDSADSGYPLEVSDNTWPGLGSYASQIVAAFKASSSKGYFFLADGRYLRYDLNSDSVDSGYPKDVNNSSWPGLAPYATQIRAALKWPNSKVYFFLADGSYLRYDMNNDSLDGGYPKPINNSTWPGMADYAMDITAAHQWNSSRAYIFLSNQRYLRYSISGDQVDSGYPRAINGNTWPGLMNP
ncbi:hemopexin repeat-containing protein [Microbulbifer sp. CAU 1566]|uniref:alkaline phosphatase family protein n=1 Tax=Microbulbifer sp. CAU 1566 TaxID=2933269 RepID=UPI002006C968|nr:alkaline phosphatase family protein [Microbulbifer sp. CAU 1566]MCK7598262.1 hemopexin repeat-containing protein [Microbulbifer sp. CAU 1566]